MKTEEQTKKFLNKDDEKYINMHDEESNVDDVSETENGTQHIKTAKTRTVHHNDKTREVLIGKDISEVKEINEEFDSLESRLLNKLS